MVLGNGKSGRASYGTALGRLRQNCESEASLGYTSKTLSQNTETKQNK
jgi:hypothetical protein